MEKTPNSLAGRLRAGNRAAAAELVDMYYQQLYLYLRRLGHSTTVSEDLMQQCFIKAWQNIGQLRSDKSLGGWLFHIAGNVSNQYWRGHKSDNELSIEGDEIDTPDGNEAEPDKMEHRSDFERIKNAVVNLPMKLRQAVILHYMQLLTIEEAAEAAGVREGTFKSRLNRALKSLRKGLSEENGEL